MYSRALRVCLLSVFVASGPGSPRRLATYASPGFGGSVGSSTSIYAYGAAPDSTFEYAAAALVFPAPTRS